MISLRSIRWKPLLLLLLVTLGTGALSGFVSGNSAQAYQAFARPPLSPPGWVFPVVWSILYVLMAVSAYLIYVSDAPGKEKRKALGLFAAQLIVNFLWSPVFFGLKACILALFLLLVLWALILSMIMAFAKISKPAARLQLPYLLWVTFAGYLNLSICILNL